ncbi:hypothetical protein [Caballeronia cordobensis]|uniref:hypothetical protein n=1 Tax=Caballeronia cordobensis TaxID=1353886 RepID=UPI001359B89A|nr:hypothetical protein [Caballeronia cordobensis]
MRLHYERRLLAEPGLTVNSDASAFADVRRSAVVEMQRAALLTFAISDKPTFASH